MKLCIVHALQDDFYLQELLKHLYPLEQQDLIQVWYSQKVLAGGKTEEVLKEQLQAAEVWMPLLSADFLASKGCEKMEAVFAAKTMKKDLVVMPVLLRHCQWELTFFKKFRLLPNTRHPIHDDSWKSTDQAMDKVVDELRRLLQAKEVGGEESNPRKEAISASKKMALLIKNLQVRSEPNEHGHFKDFTVSEKILEKLAEYLTATEKMEVIEIEGVRFSRAELLVKKASLDFKEAYAKGWKKHIELQNRSFFSLTKGIENLGNTGLMLYKRHQTNSMLKEARELEPENIEVLLESMRFLVMSKPKDVKGKTAYITQIKDLLKSPKNDLERFQLALAKLYEAIQPFKISRSLMESVRADFDAIGKKNYVAYCDNLLQGGKFVT